MEEFGLSPCFPSPKNPHASQLILTCDHNVTFESRCLHWYRFIEPLGWIETERGAFAVSVPFPISVNFASGISLSITVPFSIALSISIVLTLANSVCFAAVRCADTVSDRIAIAFRFPALSAKGIAFLVGRLFKPGFSRNTCVAITRRIAHRTAPA